MVKYFDFKTLRAVIRLEKYR